ncbi:hypothetical protein Tco_1346046 [Tanacetum coccineum]
MNTRAFNSELVEPLFEPERTLNRRHRRRNRRVPFERKDERPAQPRIVYLPILDINYFRHFLDILENYNPLDDEPMWAADRVVAPTLGSAITIPETSNEFAIKAQNEHVNAVFTRSGKSYDPCINPNDQQNDYENPINFDSEDEEEESTSQPKSQTSTPIKETLIPKPYKPKIPYPQRIRKEKMEAQYGKFLDMIQVVRINVPLVDVIAGMPNYEEDYDALLDEGSEILHSIEGTILEEKIFAEFNEFMAMNIKENSDTKSKTEELPFKKIIFNTNYKIKTSLEEPFSDLELKPLPDHLKYVFLEEPTFLPVIISSHLSEQNRNKLIYILKGYKQAFAWKTTDIPGICQSFCKHKIQLLEDIKPVVKKQRQLNPNMQEVIKKEIIKLLDTGIFYPIANSP